MYIAHYRIIARDGSIYREGNSFVAEWQMAEDALRELSCQMMDGYQGCGKSGASYDPNPPESFAWVSFTRLPDGNSTS